jgi:hypothetical protein
MPGTCFSAYLAVGAIVLLLPYKKIQAEPRINWDGNSGAHFMRKLLEAEPPAVYVEKPSTHSRSWQHAAERPRGFRSPVILYPMYGDYSVFYSPLYPIPAAPRGGYYYGLFLGSDGNFHFRKLYFPHYGPFDGEAHNNPFPFSYFLCRRYLHLQPYRPAPVRKPRIPPRQSF